MLLAPRARLVSAALFCAVAFSSCRQAPAPSPLVVDYVRSPFWPDVLVVLDSTAFSLDTATVRRLDEDRILRTLDGRTIDSIRYIPPDSAVRLFGSRAARGAVRIWARPRGA
jgi:hypothetical protein